MLPESKFRPYTSADLPACLALFDANSPAFFAPNERKDYEKFLDRHSDRYVVCTLDDAVVGAYGIYPVGSNAAALHWILLSPSAQGQGIGSVIMSRVRKELRDKGRAILHISASHKSAPFFARFGAVETSRIPDGWGPGMHRVEMEIGL